MINRLKWTSLTLCTEIKWERSEMIIIKEIQRGQLIWYDNVNITDGLRTQRRIWISLGKVTEDVSDLHRESESQMQRLQRNLKRWTARNRNCSTRAKRTHTLSRLMRAVTAINVSNSYQLDRQGKYSPAVPGCGKN